MKRTILRIGFILPFLAAFLPHTATAEGAGPQEEFFRARVVEIVSERTDDIGGTMRQTQTVKLRLTEGPSAGEEVTIENSFPSGKSDMKLAKGETIVTRKLQKIDGSIEYLLTERYRLPGIIILSLFFIVLAVILGGLTGLRSMIGLAVSVLVLVLFVVPSIVRGANPMLISLIGSFVIACTSLFLAHGFNKRTSVALLSTLTTLVVATVLAVIFVRFGKLFGMGTEEAMFLQTGEFANVDLRGLLLGGIIIGCLGVLDDITTAQTAAVDEIRKANPSLSFNQLQKAGFSVGKEHIASLINTLALAYAGASLPLLLLFEVNSDYPLWITLNSEFLAEEIIRTLVGSSTLLFAVPISTWFAATLLTRGGTSKGHHAGSVSVASSGEVKIPHGVHMH